MDHFQTLKGLRIGHVVSPWKCMSPPTQHKPYYNSAASALSKQMGSAYPRPRNLTENLTECLGVFVGGKITRPETIRDPTLPARRRDFEVKRNLRPASQS
eukprot:3690341-Lingulodinium_polyedra.AAC.1